VQQIEDEKERHELAQMGIEEEPVKK